MRTHFLVVLAVVLMSTTSKGQINYTSTAVEVPLKRTVDITKGDGKPAYNPRIEHLEAPYPGGNVYRTLLKDRKKASRKLVQENSSKRSALATDPSINPIVIDGMAMIREVPVPALDTTYVSEVVGGTPLDNTMAISKNGILLASVNSILWGYDVFNDSILFKTPEGITDLITFSEFADTLIENPTQAFPFDPKLLYDSNRDRFIFVFLAGRGPSDSQCLIGFSSSNDPRDPWHVYSLPGNPRANGNNWADYPAISLTENELFFTINMIIPNTSWQAGFDGTLIWQINLDDGFSGAANLSTRMWDDITLNGEYIRYLCPVEGASGPAGPNAYFMSNHPWDAQNDTLILVEINNEADQNPSLNVKTMKAPTAYGMPPNGRQEDTPVGLEDSLGLQTNDARYLGAVVNGNTIEAVANTRNFSTGNAAIYHATISNITSTNPSANAAIIGIDSLDLGYPKICYPSDGTTFSQYVIGFNHTARTEYAGVSAVVYDSQSGNYSEVTRLKAGEGYVRNISGAYERWGDYFGIQTAPYAPGRIWTAGFYGLENNSSSTWISELSLADENLLSTTTKAKNTQVNLYPNPFNDEFQVEFEVNSETRIHITVVDLKGSNVADFGIAIAQPGLNRFSFKSSELPTGFYLVKGTTENGESIFTKKVIRENR